VSRHAGRPRVIANFAVTADGKVSTRNFTPTVFTSKADKRRLLEIRSLGDALLVGARTIATDRMSMRLPAIDLQGRRRALGLASEPLRVIVSNGGKIDLGWKVFQTPGSQVIAFSTRRMPRKLRLAVARVADLWIFDSPAIDVPAMLRILQRDYRVRTIVCEGGPRLFCALLKADAVDELHLTWTPLIFGGARAPTLTGIPGQFLPQTVHFRLKQMQVHGQECFLTYTRSRRGPRSCRPAADDNHLLSGERS
jgi:riboflavin-specific deaminase-like protein